MRDKGVFNLAKKKEPIVNKMYEWELEVDGAIVKWKCFVGENECITYEGDRECKHLKIMDKTQAQGVLQIDCVTRVWDELVPFQLENGIPYIKLEDEDGERKWRMSDTTREDRIQARIRQVKKEAYLTAGAGVVLLLIVLAQFLITGTLGEWNVIPMMGILCFAAAAMNMVRLRNELQAMGRPFSWTID